MAVRNNELTAELERARDIDFVTISRSFDPVSGYFNVYCCAESQIPINTDVDEIRAKDALRDIINENIDRAIHLFFRGAYNRVRLSVEVEEVYPIYGVNSWGVSYYGGPGGAFLGRSQTFVFKISFYQDPWMTVDPNSNVPSSLPAAFAINNIMNEIDTNNAWRLRFMANRRVAEGIVRRLRLPFGIRW